MKRIVTGILAHVDAGKTTLSEALLYQSGQIRSMGRVDHGDAFLDTDPMEKQRGITIFSKEARLRHGHLELTLLDTPGHIDFSAETERTLSILDYAILLVSATDGLRGYTQTLWRLLERYRVPSFVFVNKMDMGAVSQAEMLDALRSGFSSACMDFTDACAGSADPTACGGLADSMEDIALLDEAAMNEYLETGRLADDTLASLIASRKLMPCLFGSALKLEGIDRLLTGLETFAREPSYSKDFGARVYKVSHDERGDRLTWVKVTGGNLPVKTAVTDPGDQQSAAGEGWSEKVDQIRLYSGAKYQLADQVTAGTVCALTGLSHTFPGQGLGVERQGPKPLLEPVLTYRVLPTGADIHKLLQALRTLEDEDPLLQVRWQERLHEIHLQLMGAVQLEVIQQLLQDRFGLGVTFGPGSIMYRETITAPVEGVGHFEPLRHYAEVHLLLEPTQRGSGLTFASNCSLDQLDRNWQRLILTHLGEKEHVGVETGSPITDMRITLLAGRGHVKHTEGGDFRQATYRAIRQGLMKARVSGNSLLLEPWYRFRMDLPHEMLGHAMADVQRMSGTFESPQAIGGGSAGAASGACGLPDPGGPDDGYAILQGRAPVEQMRDYAMEVSQYTHGQGNLVCLFDGYAPCHNAAQVIEEAAYDPEADLENTPDSVFCAHGAGYPVAWTKVEDFMHMEGGPYIRPESHRPEA
ncbi:GTP-binding protein [Bifidobacterium aemilianum]|uniref:GTP-binding protein n=1 Tax=Bifidobacterium aemilianum TaxID=2493120 RepID=A0A366KBI2_9BIFI|nr:TetM/TetW/TetO/TetS family tetracycline resistance ribosomal protection protein [Bifidobacterium aemilianum]RBP98602.1 GTP-binding protein [Bifidobacterium aemilianum]